MSFFQDGAQLGAYRDVGLIPELSAVHSDRATRFLCCPAPQEGVGSCFRKRGALSLYATHRDLALGEQGGLCLSQNAPSKVPSCHMND
jgi:hypothetical protein